VASSYRVEKLSPKQLALETHRRRAVGVSRTHTPQFAQKETRRDAAKLDVRAEYRCGGLQRVRSCAGLFKCPNPRFSRDVSVQASPAFSFSSTKWRWRGWELKPKLGKRWNSKFLLVESREICRDGTWVFELERDGEARDKRDEGLVGDGRLSSNAARKSVVNIPERVPTDGDDFEVCSCGESLDNSFVSREGEWFGVFLKRELGDLPSLDKLREHLQGQPSSDKEARIVSSSQRIVQISKGLQQKLESPHSNKASASEMGVEDEHGKDGCGLFQCTEQGRVVVDAETLSEPVDRTNHDLLLKLPKPDD